MSRLPAITRHGPGRQRPSLRAFGVVALGAGAVAQGIGGVVWLAANLLAGNDSSGARAFAVAVVAAAIPVVVLGAGAVLWAELGARVGAVARRAMAAGAVTLAVGAALVGGIVIGSTRQEPSTGPVPTSAPIASPQPSQPLSPSTTAPAAPAASSSSSSTGAGSGEPSLGAIIASQGLGSNAPAPSLPDVTFPSGSDSGRGSESAPWSATAPVVPVSPSTPSTTPTPPTTSRPEDHQP